MIVHSHDSCPMEHTQRNIHSSSLYFCSPIKQRGSSGSDIFRKGHRNRENQGLLIYFPPDFVIIDLYQIRILLYVYIYDSFLWEQGLQILAIARFHWIIQRNENVKKQSLAYFDAINYNYIERKFYGEAIN